MADNVTLNTGSGGAVLATDEIAGVHHQQVKLEYGAADSATMVDTSNPLPVDLRADNLAGNLDINLAASGITLTVDSELPAAAALGDGDANPTAPAVGAFLMGFNGTTWDRLRLDGSDNLQVNLANALPAGTNNIGDVDVVSVNPGTGATDLGKAEDDAHTSGDVGVMAMAVRTDSPVNRSGLDGDYEPLQLSGGRLWASATIDAALPTGANTIGSIANITGVVSPGTGAAHLGKAIDNASSGTDTGIASLAIRDDALTTLTPIDGDYVPLLTNDRGALWTKHDGDITIADGGNTITVDGTVTAAQATPANLNAQVVGDVAHDGVDSGNPVKIGGVARQANPTAVAAGDRVDLYCDDLGKAVVYPIAPRDRIVQNRIVLSTTTETTLIAAGGAGVFRDIVQLVVSNESATEVRVDFRDSTTGTIRLSIDLAPDGGGGVIPLTVPLPQAAANNNWTAQLSAAVSSVYITAVAVEQN